MPGRRLIAVAVALLLAGAGQAHAEEMEHHLKTWMDKDGVVHMTLGPSTKARAKAQRLSLVPHSTRKKEKVRDSTAFDEHIANAAQKYNIPEELVRAVIVAESNFNPDAVSRVGARGLMQLMPGTGAAMYVSDLHDPVQNIYGGTRYLRVLANMFKGDMVKTVAAYNAGPEAVRKAKGIPRISETQGYVAKVIKLYRIYKGLD
jgi:soluble lytic murein transglycosylase-like protein